MVQVYRTYYALGVTYKTNFTVFTFQISNYFLPCISQYVSLALKGKEQSSPVVNLTLGNSLEHNQRLHSG